MRASQFAGILLGLVLAAMAMELTTTPTVHLASSTRLISECDGSLRSIVIQYTSQSKFTLTAYRDFLTQLDSHVTVYVACPSDSDFQDFRQSLPPVNATLIPVIAGHPITC